MSTISRIAAREILDSRGNPTVAVTVELAKTTLGGVLDEALDQCGLVLVVRDGRLVVTTAPPKRSK